MSKFTQDQIEKSKQDLLDYISISPRLPGDLEDYFCPVMNVDEEGYLQTAQDAPCSVELNSTLPSVLHRWKSSVYFIALTELVKKGAVQWRRDDVGFVWYFARSLDSEPASL